MIGVENIFIYCPGSQKMGPGRQFQQIYCPGKPPGPISPEHLDRVSKKVNFLKKQPFGRSNCCEIVDILNNYLFWRKSSSETVAVLQKAFIFKKQLIRKRICYVVVVIRKNQLLQTTRYSEKNRSAKRQPFQVTTLISI